MLIYCPRHNKVYTDIQEDKCECKEAEKVKTIKDTVDLRKIYLARTKQKNKRRWVCG